MDAVPDGSSKKWRKGPSRNQKYWMESISAKRAVGTSQKGGRVERSGENANGGEAEENLTRGRRVELVPS